MMRSTVAWMVAAAACMLFAAGTARAVPQEPAPPAAPEGPASPPDNPPPPGQKPPVAPAPPATAQPPAVPAPTPPPPAPAPAESPQTPVGGGEGVTFRSADGNNSLQLGFAGQIRFRVFDRTQYRRTNRSIITPPIPVENIGQTEQSFS